MPVTEVNAHVLLPHLPDWSRPVQWSRAWRTDVQRVLTGAEERRALRPKPRGSLSWRVLPFDVTEQTPLLARLRAAAKSGLACAPYWGRGRRVVSAAGTELVIEEEAWPWFEADDFLLLRSLEADPVEAFELAQAEAVNGDTLTLKAALIGTWGEGTWAWPLVFGRLTFSDLSHRTDWHAGVTVTLAELVVRPDPPEWESICFIDPWGACESWNNFADQAFALSFADAGHPLSSLSYACMGVWFGHAAGSAGEVDSFTWLADFAFIGMVKTFTANGEAWNLPQTFPFWTGNAFGISGVYETWSNLEDGVPEASWTGGRLTLSQDQPVDGLVIWVAAAFSAS
jgi:hypothetical protein